MKTADTHPDRWRFWIDRGGTFTDVVGCAPDGCLHARKLLSNDPTRGEDAVVAGIRELLEVATGAPLPLERIVEVRVGTTVATNALLERKGVDTLFVTNAGLGDLLRIGDQSRPELFALNIRRVAPLYKCVATTTLRLDVDGNTITELDESACRDALQAAYAAGCSSCAIALMHAWRYPEQERRVAALAREIGFDSLVMSHQVSTLMRLLPRAATTVVEAYLKSLLRRYTGRLAQALPGVPLSFMKSDGGLAGGGNLAARDALLSGPAGGVVGAVETARRVGCKQVIGFDMGGTSTDVCHHAGAGAGEWERRREVEIAGHKLLLPMLAVETVAAGGGSIIGFDGGRLTVGPASAGAEPGPACYRRGGPLTVTDCNLLLGRIAAEYFPTVFGADGRQPLDADASAQGFAALAQQVFECDGQHRSAESLAAGALAVAVEHMAGAIRRISVARGHDPSTCALNSFGGAGGQHACAVADALGMRKILIHPLAGVLSALGIGLSDRSVLLERGLELELPGAYTQAAEQARALEQEARERLAQDLPDTVGVSCEVTALLRYAGNETALPVAFGDADALVASFAEAHRRHYGFVLESRGLVLAALRVEVRAVSAPPQWASVTEGDMPPPLETRRVWCGEGFVDTPFYRRVDLPAGAELSGPAVLVEATGTTVIEPGWHAEIADGGELLMRRAGSSNKPRHGKTRDPVTLELMAARFMGIAEEMGEALRASAQSVNVRERLDYSCALFDADGALVANAPHVPVHLGAMSATIQALLAEHQPNAGEVWVTNDVYRGGTHLPDITVITPVFTAEFADGARPAFFVASRAHHADVGGVTPGSMPADSRHIDEEGVLIPFTRLVVDGRFQEATMRAMLLGAQYPARNVEANLADLRAQLAANERGGRELLSLAQTRGLASVQAYMRHLADYADEAVRRALRRLPASGHFEAPLDDGSRIKLAVSIDQQQGTALFDFTGTSAARDGNFNAPRAVVRAAVLYVLRCLIDADIPLNDGCLRPVQIRVPAGSMLDPQYPHAVVAGNVEVSQVLTDALLAALGQLAASQGTMNNLSFGNARHQHYETLAGGAGAGADFDGASAVHTHMTNSCLTDPELMEYRFPVRVEAFGVREGSGGAGAHRGGDGLVRRIRFMEPMTVNILSNRRRTEPFGLAGGAAGARGENLVIRPDGVTQPLDYAERTELNTGDAIEIRTPGGGGHG